MQVDVFGVGILLGIYVEACIAPFNHSWHRFTSHSINLNNHQPTLIAAGSRCHSCITFLEHLLPRPTVSMVTALYSVNLSRWREMLSSSRKSNRCTGLAWFRLIRTRIIYINGVIVEPKIILNAYFIRGINGQDWGRKSTCCSISSKPIELMHLWDIFRCEVKLWETRGLLVIPLPLEFAWTWVPWRFVRYLAKE